VAASGGSATAELAAGTYTISATAYTGSGDSAAAAAVGEKTGVTVKSGETTEAALTLRPTAGGPNGFLSYAITIPPGVSASDTVITAAGGTVNNGELSLTAGPNTGTRELAPGFYTVRGVLSKGDRSRNKAEDVVIYSGLTSTLAKAYSDADLSGEDANPAPPVTGGLGVTIGFIDYTGALVIGGNNGTNTIVQGGNPSALVLNTPAGYTNMAWYLDGASTPFNTEGSVTLEAEDYEVRVHSVTFTGLKGGIPYSQTLPFTVEAVPDAGNGGITAAKLAPYLATIPPGSPQDPTTIRFDSRLYITSYDWGITIKATLQTSKKYVVLDLSDCKAKNNRISGNGSSGNDFNVIKPLKANETDPADYIVGIILPSSLTEIGDSAFSGLDTIRRVTIPEGVTTIGSNAFSGCTMLSSISFPESLTAIGSSAFKGSGLSSVTIPNGVVMGNGVFQGCTGLTSVTISAGVQGIEDSSFMGCTALSSIEIPDTVTTIGTSAFKDCTGLTTVVIPEGITTIRAAAFSGCRSLTAIDLPDTVTSIGSNAFTGCKSLTAVTIPSGVTTLSYSLFSTCEGLITVTIQGAVTSIDNAAFDACQSLSGFIIPETVTSIGGHAFWGTTSLTSITIPAGIPMIRNGTFGNCIKLTSVTFAGNNTMVETDASFYVFSGNSLKSVYTGQGTYVRSGYNWSKQ
jgi:hypothetical protein